MTPVQKAHIEIRVLVVALAIMVLVGITAVIKAQDYQEQVNYYKGLLEADDQTIVELHSKLSERKQAVRGLQTRAAQLQDKLGKEEAKTRQLKSTIETLRKTVKDQKQAIHHLK